jgi:hypothetical protein
MFCGTMVFYWPGARRQWPVSTFGTATLNREGEDPCESSATPARKGSFQRVLHDKEELLVIPLRIPLSIINKNCDQLSARDTRRHTDAEYTAIRLVSIVDVNDAYYRLKDAKRAPAHPRIKVLWDRSPAVRDPGSGKILAC